jgi:hypothetical protein
MQKLYVDKKFKKEETHQELFEEILQLLTDAICCEEGLVLYT